MKPSVLYLTDLYYPAKGRKYYEEDLWLSGELRREFEIALCHPADAAAFEDAADLIVFRNTGSVMGYPEVYAAFRERVREKHLRTFNTFTGKADMCGKAYLPALTREGFPVIPTVDRTEDLSALPDVPRYVIKPMDGADSIGLEFLTKDALLQRTLPDHRWLIQPAVDFVYEVSFYFINDRFCYAMYAPDPARRWELVPYAADAADIAFARRFIGWNTIPHGIQRVDACRTKDGALLLVELEDLNPYLSLL
ncbi:MAG: hypothetical protein IJV58_07000 [Oscillospiraceae bacterium]|nr:hypothetical protein [Oscillospiraceae bacterium]